MGIRTWQPFPEGDLDGLGRLDDAVVVEVRPERADRHLLELAAKVREELHPELSVVLKRFHKNYFGYSKQTKDDPNAGNSLSVLAHVCILVE